MIMIMIIYVMDRKCSLGLGHIAHVAVCPSVRPVQDHNLNTKRHRKTETSANFPQHRF